MSDKAARLAAVAVDVCGSSAMRPQGMLRFGRVRLLALLCSVCTAAVAFSAGSALAATLSVQSGFLAQYTAATGEANNLSVGASGGAFGCPSSGCPILFQDPGAQIFVGTGCQRTSTGAASCSATRARVSAGDLNDIVNATNAANFISINGGLGNDQLTGTGRGDNALGTTRGDTLFGEAGDDRLDGGAGVRSDRLSPGLGVDTAFARAGEDQIFARDGVADNLSCGEDLDEIELDLQDRIPADCELVSRAAIDQGPTVEIRSRRLTLRRGGIRVRLHCPSAQSRGCSGRLTIKRRKAGSPTLARRSYTIDPDRSRTVTLRPSSRRLEQLRRKRRVSVRVGSLERDANGRPMSAIAKLTLKTR